MKVLVTGANGQLGSEMRLIAMNSPHAFVFSDVTELPGVETVHLDITDLEAVRTMVEKENIDIPPCKLRSKS